MKFWIELSKNVLVEAKIKVASPEDQVIIQIDSELEDADLLEKFPSAFRDQVRILRHPVEVVSVEEVIAEPATESLGVKESEARADLPKPPARTRSPLSPPPRAEPISTSLRTAMANRDR